MPPAVQLGERNVLTRTAERRKKKRSFDWTPVKTPYLVSRDYPGISAFSLSKGEAELPVGSSQEPEHTSRKLRITLRYWRNIAWLGLIGVARSAIGHCTSYGQFLSIGGRTDH
jgi:hypothetical protein